MAMCRVFYREFLALKPPSILLKGKKVFQNWLNTCWIKKILRSLTKPLWSLELQCVLLINHYAKTVLIIIYVLPIKTNVPALSPLKEIKLSGKTVISITYTLRVMDVLFCKKEPAMIYGKTYTSFP